MYRLFSILRRRGKAQGMVEFALALPLLLLLVYGIIEAGRLLFIYSMTMTSSREAARYGSASGDIGGYVARYKDCAGIRSAAKRVGSLAGISDGSITITFDRGPGSSAIASCTSAFTITDASIKDLHLGDRVVVQVVGSFRPLLPGLVPFSNFPITAVTRRTIIKDVEIEGTPPPPIPPKVRFLLESQTQLESAGDIPVRILLSAPSSNTVTVPFTVNNLETSGADYTLGGSSPVVFAPGETFYDLIVSINNEDMDEDDERLEIYLGTPTNATLEVPSQHTLTIVDDDDPPLVFFVSPGQSISEESDISIGIGLSAASSRDITVHFSVAGTASQGLGENFDYSITSSPLVIPAGAAGTSILAVVNDDLMDEEDETIFVQIGAVDNATRDDTQAVHTATIIDNDLPPLVSFTWAEQSAEESDGEMIAQLQLSAVSSWEITVPFSISGTAERGTDFTVSASPVVIPAGSTTADITIQVLDDGDLTEDDETVILTMLAPVNARPGAPGVHTATITSDPVIPEVSFSASSQTVSETVGGVTITILAQLSSASSRNITVPFNVGGAAIRGTDYTIDSSPAIIPAGGASVEIQINILDDFLDENNETVVVTMGTPTHATKGSPSVHTATITDNDEQPVVFFALGAQTQLEDIGSLAVSVQLNALSSLDISVPFTTSGTATTGSDFTVPASPLVIPAGSLGASILVTVTDDSVYETNEQIILTLGSPTNAVQGSPSTHTATITDNDPVCPTAVSPPVFSQASNKNLLFWNLSSTNPLVAVNLRSVTIRWPVAADVNISDITFGNVIYSGNAPPPYLSVNTPVPLWSGVFNTSQLIFIFNRNPKSVVGDTYQVTATFENCLPITATIPSP